MESFRWATLTIAVIGATLGVFNAWWMIRRDAVRLRVRFMTIYLPGRDLWTHGIEVVNASYFAVTVTEVGLQNGRFAKRRGAITGDFLGQVSLPHRLEPRTSITVAASPNSIIKATHCRASTACGLTVRARIRRG